MVWSGCCCPDWKVWSEIVHFRNASLIFLIYWCFSSESSGQPGAGCIQYRSPYPTGRWPCGRAPGCGWPRQLVRAVRLSHVPAGLLCGSGQCVALPLPLLLQRWRWVLDPVALLSLPVVEASTGPSRSSFPACSDVLDLPGLPSLPSLPVVKASSEVCTLLVFLPCL